MRYEVIFNIIPNKWYRVSIIEFEDYINHIITTDWEIITCHSESKLQWNRVFNCWLNSLSFRFYVINVVTNKSGDFKTAVLNNINMNAVQCHCNRCTMHESIALIRIHVWTNIVQHFNYLFTYYIYHSWFTSR